MSAMGCSSLRVQEPADGERKLTPVLSLGGQALPAGGGERIDPRLAAVVAGGHLGREKAGSLEPVQRRVERALADRERVAGVLLNPLLDAPAVIRPEGDGAEDQQIERALQLVRVGHGAARMARGEAR